MARSVQLFNFAGVTPIGDDALLDANVAMVARDVDLHRGDIIPLRGSLPLQTEPYEVKTIVDVGYDRLKTLSYESDVAFGTPSGYDTGMVFWIKNQKVMYSTIPDFVNGIETSLGVPRPSNVPNWAGIQEGQPVCDEVEGCEIFSAYCSTYVNSYGQESAPSPVLVNQPFSTRASVTVSFSDSVEYDQFGNRVPVGYDGRYILYRRVYRTIPTQTTGSEPQLQEGGDWFLAAEVIYNPSASGSQQINLEPMVSQIEVLPSIVWEVPPAADHLVMCPDTDTLVLAKGNVVYFSEPGNHHAFSRERDVVLSDNIVALAYFGGMIVVLTDGHPYVLTPMKSESGTPVYDVQREDEAYPCVSKASVSVGSTGVVWASTDGVFTMNKTRYGWNIKSLTSVLFHLEDWQSCLPETIRGALHNGSYFFTSDGEMVNSITGDGSHSWILTYDKTIYDQPKNIFLTTLTSRPAIWYKSRRDKLYAGMGYSVFEWNPHDGMVVNYEYATRILVEPGLTNYSAAKVVNDSDGELTFEIWRENNGDPVKLYSRRITHSNPFRLPSGMLSVDHFVRLWGTSRIRRIHLADSLLALTNTDDTTMTYGNSRLTQRG